MSSFKEQNSFIKRQTESDRVRSKFSDRIPVICERDPRSDLPPLDKIKYLVPRDLTLAQFNYVIRKRIKLAPEKAMFLFVNNIVPSSSELMSVIYDKHADSDGFIYFSCTSMATFGSP